MAVSVLFVALFSGFAYAQENKTGIVTGSVLNLRQSSNTASTVLAKLEKGAKVTVLNEEDGWVQVTYNDITGWVTGEYLSVTTPEIGTGTVLVERANVRSEPNTSSKILVKVSEGEKVSVRSRSGDWYSIVTANELSGWISQELLDVKAGAASRGDEEQIAPEELAAEAQKAENPEASIGEKIVEYAKKFIGVKYKWGGNTPKTGFDCSGFAKYVYADFGIDLNRVAADQARQGTKVSKSELAAGDLVFFDTDGGLNNISHVGVYIGDGRFIHAASSRSVYKVTISEINTGYYSQTFMSARRFAE